MRYSSRYKTEGKFGAAFACPESRLFPAVTRGSGISLVKRISK